MNILIVGNGFDIAHKLPTSYKDFLNFYIEKFQTNINYLDSTDRHLLENNLWLKHFITRQNDIGDNWIDFEKEIYEIIRNFSKLYPFVTLKQPSNFKPQRLTIQKNLPNFTFTHICGQSKENYQEIEYNKRGYLIKNMETYAWLDIYYETPVGLLNFLYDQLRDFTEAFATYLNKNVLSELNNTSQYNMSLLAKHQQTDKLYVLSFNYTNTCEKLYQRSNSCTSTRIQTFYVHGQINNSNGCNLVLGTQSFKNKEDNIPVEFNIFSKHNQRHKYGTIEDYQNLLKEIHSKQIKHPIFYVIGHSLDESDHAILKHIFDADKNAPIKIYYHDEYAQEKLINNITDIIGEDAVMARVQLIDQHDSERGILIENASRLISC